MMGGSRMPVTTKDSITAAFLDAASKKSIDKVTVKDVVEACGITRKTFYYYFRDIMDVIEWSLKQHEEVLLQHSLKASSMWDALRILVSSIEDRPEITISS